MRNLLDDSFGHSWVASSPREFDFLILDSLGA